MTKPHDSEDGRVGDTFDRALDGAFEAARARPDDASPSAPSVLDRIAAKAGRTPSISLGAGGEQRPADDAHEAGKYVVLGPLGQGGIGVVLRGQDRDLGREVAMKFLRDGFEDDASILYRFVEEAQIGGQLQHPGIVPVYDLGIADGKPFFTMKLVDGQTLANALFERESPASDRGHFLGIFEQVCQTMAYAHAHGVVHRDLKPANVMIGAFGEVQVVDWGMGKVLRADHSEQAGAPATVRTSDDSTRSVHGSVMGTPAYMPPEQATGSVDELDERSDVFALGAILCEILTGKPPYVGEPREVLELAAVADLREAAARLDRCDEAELVALAKQCLARDRSARPESAMAVAKAVHDYLASVERRAHEARVRAAALERTQKLGIALTATIAVGLAASLWFWRSADEAAADAKSARKVAEANLDNFNYLSYVVRLETARENAKGLLPARASMAPKMRAWLTDEAIPVREAVGELRDTVAKLAKKALKRTPAEKAEDRRKHPRGEELEQLQKKVAALSRARAVRVGGAEPAAFVLDEASLPKTAAEVRDRAFGFVNPLRKTFGREAEALALARKAIEMSKPNERPGMLYVLAYALFENGYDEEALARMKESVTIVVPAQRKNFESYVKKLEQEIADANGEPGKAAIETVEKKLAELEAEVDRDTLRFADGADRFLYRTLLDLVADIESFEPEIARVERRLFWAEHVDELTITRYEDRWAEARRAILAADDVSASKLYREAPIELAPQVGLVPIGMNPKTKLWEFYHLRSAWDPSKTADPAQLPIPKHAADGSLQMRGSGIVFVLVPGGSFAMGSQNRSENLPNYDRFSQPYEQPVHVVELAPYFLSRYEMTQGQWARLSGGEYPSWYKIGVKLPGNPGDTDESYPVENVSWTMCDRLLTPHGLVLPTEAQWERACRAGTTTPWSVGKDPSKLLGSANVLDLAARRTAPVWPGGESFNDGFKGPAPVGSFASNDYGLHDMHGNVHEWCRDGFAKNYSLSARTGDGLRGAGLDLRFRTFRGGGYANKAEHVRSAMRGRNNPTDARADYGVRPARVIEN